MSFSFLFAVTPIRRPCMSAVLHVPFLCQRIPSAPLSYSTLFKRSALFKTNYSTLTTRGSPRPDHGRKPISGSPRGEREKLKSLNCLKSHRVSFAIVQDFHLLPNHYRALPPCFPSRRWGGWLYYIDNSK